MNKEILYGALFENYSLDRISVDEAVQTFTESCTDASNQQIQFLERSADKYDYLYKISGVASKGGQINRNERMYPTEVLEKAVNQAQRLIKRGKFCGELDHPGFGDARNGSLKNTAIRFTKLWMEGPNMRYEGIITTNSKGDELARLLESGVGAGMSTRGYGSVNRKEISGRKIAVVEMGFELLGIDAVLMNSSQSAEHIKYNKEGVDESTEGGNDNMNLDELKKNHPELVTALKEEWENDTRSTIEEEVNANFADKVSKAVQEKKEEIRKDILENDEGIKALRTVATDIQEAIAPLVKTEDEQVTDLKAQLEAKEDELSKVNDKIAALEDEKKELEGKLTEQSTKEEMNSYVEEKVKGHKFEKQLRNRLADYNFDSKEKVDEAFDREVTAIQALLDDFNIDTPAGSGQHQESDDNGADGSELTEEQKKQRRLAGIKDEGGNE